METYSRRNPPPSIGIDFSDSPSLTQQHFQKECDINNMLMKFGATGVLPEKEGSFYGDFSSSIDFQGAYDLVQSTMDQFLALPSICRDRFGNDPGKFLDFVSNPANAPQFAELGLVEVKIPAVPVTPLDVTGTTDTNVVKPAIGKEA